MTILANDKFIKQVNELTLQQVEFILRVWKDRISIWNPNTRSQDIVDDIWINGTAVELGIPEDHNQFGYDDWHYLWTALKKQYPEKKDLLKKTERLANEAFPIVDPERSKKYN